MGEIGGDVALLEGGVNPNFETLKIGTNGSDDLPRKIRQQIS
jgi:hypothetical protein